MGDYLDKFSSAINQKQAQQILKLLNKKRNSGQIRNIKEFSKQLSSLMSELTATTLQPTTKLFFAQAGELISSEQYNFMLDRVHDDLEASFAEANNINTIQDSHEVIVRDVILKNLRAGIAELEAKINLYEFLNRDNHNFETALFSTFRESRDNRTHSGALANNILFLDPRKPTSTDVITDATTELIGERLVLGHSAVTYHSISNVKQLYDSETPQSELSVESPHTPISNIIDNTKGTYWVQNILFSTQPQHVKVKVELDLGITREFNFIEVEPATNKILVLEAIDYVGSNNTTVRLTTNELSFDSPANIRLKKTFAQKVILTFRSEHSKPIQFTYSNTSSLFDQVATASNISPDITNAHQHLDSMLPSSSVKEVIGLTTAEEKYFSGYEFIVGIDNIRIGLASYASDSIYISKPLTISSVGQIGLKTVENRPYVNNGIIQFTDDTYSDVGFSHSSIEYWVIKQDFSIDGSLLKTTKFPILPLNTNYVHHERLVLTEKSNSSLADADIGYTTFFTNNTVGEGNIAVYRNGVLLSDETLTASPTDGWQDVTTDADKTPNNNNPMRMKIKIVAPLPGDIFTASYVPLTSSTKVIPSNLSKVDTIAGLQIIDLVGDLSAYSDSEQVVIVNDPDATNTTKEVKLYMAIILRQNTADTSLSAAVEEYTLMTSKHNLTKYEE